MADLIITKSISVPESELSFTSSKSSGPGGQHVNTTSSRVTLEWNVTESNCIGDEAKQRLILIAGRKVKANGVLQISSDQHRSNKKNKQECLSRLRGFILKALKPPKKRKSTKVPKAQKEKRRQDKKKRAETKKMRQRPES
jgi:ribosome-associated protein